MEKLIFANWKENKNLAEAKESLVRLGNLLSNRAAGERRLIVLPPIVFLPPLSELIREESLPLELGAQDVSVFPEGAYTGEVSAKMVSEFARFVLVGHSERRKNFGETAQVVNDKIVQCFKEGLLPVICVRGGQDLEGLSLPEGSAYLAYEDSSFIGGEETKDLAEVLAFFGLVRSKFTQTEIKYFYGGSVSPQNASLILEREEVDGLLVGHHSLNPESLARIFFA